MPTATYFDQMSNTSKVTLRPWLEWNRITTHFLGEIARENLKATNEMMQAAAEQFQGLSHAKGIDELWSMQAGCAAKIAPRVLEHGQQMLNTFLDTSSEYQQWFEKEMEQFYKQQSTMTEKMAEKMAERMKNPLSKEK